MSIKNFIIGVALFTATSFCFAHENIDLPKGEHKEKLTLYDLFFGNEDQYQVCYPRNHRIYVNSIFLLSGLTISLLIFLNYYRKKTQKRLLYKKKVIEDQHKNLLDSIKYAKNIQTALLPDDKFCNNNKVKVYYNPKDIVSGDFYWYHKQNEKTFYAIIDCTGHGVPGAFLSVLAHNALEFSIKQDHQNSPKKILNQMNSFVKSALKQNNAEDIKDGMEVALLIHDHNTNEICFAGANLGFYYYSENQLNFIKGAKCTVGSVENAIRSLPEDNFIRLHSGDRLFLHSDGVVDQFGEKSNKKLGSKRLREILLNYSKYDFNIHYESIVNELNLWKGNFEQTDDMIFIAIEI